MGYEKLPYSASILSTEADQQCRRIMSSLAGLERSIRGIHDSTLKDEERIQEIYRDCIVRHVVEVETFTFDRIVRKIEHRVEQLNDSMVDAMFLKERANIDKNWNNACKAAKEYLEFDIKKEVDSYDAVMSLVDIRNAAMHGNGRLTRIQKRDGSVYSRLTSIGVQIEHDLVILDEPTVRDGALATRAFIMSVDRLTWSPPDFEPDAPQAGW